MAAGRSAETRGRRRALINIIACALAVSVPASVSAQQPVGPAFGEREDFWDLSVGVHWSELPQGFQEFACGTDGGPPSIRLTGFADFAQCAPEAGTGLHEVQFRYDDLLEYWARALEAEPLIERYQGTRIFNYPVLISVLIDSDGIVRGLRAVTDDRVPDRTRQLAYTLAASARSYFGGEGWTCSDLPPAEGEEEFGGRLVKEDCWKVPVGGGTIVTEARLLRRPGQTLFDPADNRVRQGYFVSTGRFEVFDETIAFDAVVGADNDG